MSPARLRGPDGSIQRVRAILARAAARSGAFLRSLAKTNPIHAVDTLLVDAGVYDLAPNRRLGWARMLVSRFGPAAAGAVLCVIADVAAAENVISVGAVVAHRLKYLIAEPESAVSRGGPKTVEEALAMHGDQSIHDPMPRTVYGEVGGPPAPLSKSACTEALQLYRGEDSPADIAVRWGFTEEQVRAGIVWALRAGCTTDRGGEGLSVDAVTARVASGRWGNSDD